MVGLNKSKVNDYSLHDKRYKISTYLVLENTRDEAILVWSIVTFFTPTHFKIEYLRAKHIQIDKDTTYVIIDGRKSIKDTVDELDINYENKKLFPKYNKEDKIDYNI